MKTLRPALVLFLLILTASAGGCRSIHKKTQLKGGSQVIAVDAKQRFFIAKIKQEGGAEQDGTGDNATYQLQKICVEPSPDVFSVISAAMEGSAKHSDKVSAQFGLAFSEAASQLGIRTETIQLLRDAMYRICELALNGDIDRDKAVELHEKYQRSMVTLAAVSALADSSRPAPVTLQSRATLTPGTLLADLTKRLMEQRAISTEKSKAAIAAEQTLADATKKAADLEKAHITVKQTYDAAVDTVCAVTINKGSCNVTGKTIRDCGFADPDDKLCNVAIGGAVAPTTREGKASRAHEFCDSHGSQQAASQACSTLAAAKTDLDSSTKTLDGARGSQGTAQHDLETAKSDLANSRAAEAKLEADIERVESSPSLEATAQATLIDPRANPGASGTCCQASDASVTQVAKVVQSLVSQVYAEHTITTCLDAMKNQERVLDEQAAVQQRIGVLNEFINRVKDADEGAPSDTPMLKELSPELDILVKKDQLLANAAANKKLERERRRSAELGTKAVNLGKQLDFCLKFANVFTGGETGIESAYSGRPGSRPPLPR